MVEGHAPAEEAGEVEGHYLSAKTCGEPTELPAEELREVREYGKQEWTEREKLPSFLKGLENSGLETQTVAAMADWSAHLLWVTAPNVAQEKLHCHLPAMIPGLIAQLEPETARNELVVNHVA